MDFRSHFGIVLGPFWRQSSIRFRHRFLDAFSMAFFRFSSKMGPQMEPETYARSGRFASRARPGTLPERLRGANWIFHRFGISLGAHFGAIFMTFDAVLGTCVAGSERWSHHQTPHFDPPVSQGCGGDALRLQWILGAILASIFRLFRKTEKP